MATEWIDIVDTTVKIGLGALISGLTTYHVTRIKNEHDNKKNKVTIHQELILEAAQKADEYFDYTYRYFSKLDGIRLSKEAFGFDETHWEEVHQKVNKLEDELTDARANFYTAQSRLELLGLNEASNILASYRSGEDELRSFYLSGMKDIPDNETLKAWAEKYIPYKKQFRQELSKTFLGLLNV